MDNSTCAASAARAPRSSCASPPRLLIAHRARRPGGLGCDGGGTNRPTRPSTADVVSALYVVSAFPALMRGAGRRTSQVRLTPAAKDEENGSETSRCDGHLHAPRVPG